MSDTLELELQMIPILIGLGLRFHGVFSIRRQDRLTATVKDYFENILD